MKAWEVEDIRRAMKGKWVVRGGRAFSGRVSTDSREVPPGCVFFALVGERFDAHNFVGDVIGKGAAAVVVHRELAGEVVARAKATEGVAEERGEIVGGTEAEGLGETGSLRRNGMGIGGPGLPSAGRMPMPQGTAIIQVDNTVAALNRLAGAYRNDIRARVVAVGGSNGKTTTKRILHTLLMEKSGPGGGHASPKSFNNNIGMPLTLLETEAGHEYVVLEIGTNAPGEIAALGEVCRPDIAVITSIGLEHLEKLSDLAGVAAEEAAIGEFIRPGGMLVLPAESPELLAALKKCGAQKILVGVAERVPEGGGGGTELGHALFATDVKESLAGVSFSVNGRGRYAMPLLGRHNVLNAMMAMAVARKLGVTEEQIVAGLAKVQPAPGRLQPLEVGGYRVIHDAYNANPSSMEAALRTFENLRRPKPEQSRSVAILGDMLELGLQSQNMHRNVGTVVAASAIDLFIAIGPNMQHAASAAAAAGVKVRHFASTAEACRGVRAMLEPRDAILVKGSHGMALETLIESLETKG